MYVGGWQPLEGRIRCQKDHSKLQTWPEIQQCEINQNQAVLTKGTVYAVQNGE